MRILEKSKEAWTTFFLACAIFCFSKDFDFPVLILFDNIFLFLDQYKMQKLFFECNDSD